MYNPLNEDIMFQDRDLRVARITLPRRDKVAARAGRRWWRQSRPETPRGR